MTEPARGAQRWELMFTRQAEKTLRQLPPELLQPIDRAILALAENPYPPAGQKLPGQVSLYRLHVAEWRIAYAVEDQRLTVLIGAVLQSPDGQRFILFTGEMKNAENGAEAAADEHSPEARLQAGAVPQPHSEEIRWCIVFCHQGYEQKVQANLLHRIKAMGLENKIFQVIVPLDDAGEASMAPSYIFVQMIIDEDTWYIVKNSPGVSGFFGSGDQPTTFNTAEIDYLLKRIGAKPLKQEAGFREGQKVHIIDGPFAGFVGLVYAVDEARARLNVEIDLFHRKTPVELDFSQVEKIVS
jgi:transcriptional antiterminator NusG